MSIQRKAFCFSLVGHIVVIGVIFAAGMLVPKTRVMVLDFSMSPASADAREQTAASRPSMQRPKAEPREEKTHVPTEQNGDAVPLPRDIVTEEPKPTAAQTPDTIHSEHESPTSAAASFDNPSEANAHYLQAHFGYIRDRIMRNLSYPGIARSMGLSGKLKVSFTIRDDGCAENIRIIDSTGHQVLDTSAINAIKRASPFPKPPMQAELIMPIVYRLR
jgi:protein TonB